MREPWSSYCLYGFAGVLMGATVGAGIASSTLSPQSQGVFMEVLPLLFGLAGMLLGLPVGLVLAHRYVQSRQKRLRLAPTPPPDPTVWPPPPRDPDAN